MCESSTKPHTICCSDRVSERDLLTRTINWICKAKIMQRLWPVVDRLDSRVDMSCYTLLANWTDTLAESFIILSLQHWKQSYSLNAKITFLFRIYLTFLIYDNFTFMLSSPLMQFESGLKTKTWIFELDDVNKFQTFQTLACCVSSSVRDKPKQAQIWMQRKLRRVPVSVSSHLNIRHSHHSNLFLFLFAFVFLSHFFRMLSPKLNSMFIFWI